jgi:hypothetical protein
MSNKNLPFNPETIQPYVTEKRSQFREERVTNEMRRMERCAAKMRNFNENIIVTPTYVALPDEYIECEAEIHALGHRNFYLVPGCKHTYGLITKK